MFSVKAIVSLRSMYMFKYCSLLGILMLHSVFSVDGPTTKITVGLVGLALGV